MKNCWWLILMFFFFGGTTQAQKLKRKYLSLTYMSPPTDPISAKKTFYWEATDTRMNERGEILKSSINCTSNNYDPITRLYKNSLNPMAGFKVNKTKNEAGCVLQVSTGVLQLEKKLVNKKESLKDGVKTIGVALSYDLHFSMKRSYKFTTKEGEVLHQHIDEGKEEMVFNFPRDFEHPQKIVVPGYINMAQLDANYTKFRRLFLNQVREKMIRIWTGRQRAVISSKYAERKLIYDQQVYYVKYKKGGYEDLLLAAEKMEKVGELINGNAKAWNKMNWHNQEVQQLAQECLLIWEEALATETEERELGGGRFTNEMVLALRQNILWARFLKAEHSAALIELNNLMMKSEGNKDFQRFNFVDLVNMIEDYQPRYEKNKEKYGW